VKRVLLKFISVMLVFALSSASAGLFCTGAAAEEENNFPCGGVIEQVDMKIIYLPLYSRVVIGNFGPVLTGTVLKVTYPDGESEILTVKQNGNEYYAGDYSVHINYFGFEPVITDYGFVCEPLHISDEYKLQHTRYRGETDFVYLNLPSVADIVYIISAYCRIWF